MSKYFTPIEFEVEKDPNLPRQTTVIWHQDKIEAAKAEILGEQEKIRTGTSPYTVYAVEPGRFGFPTEGALNSFVANPSDKLLKKFEEVVNSTFGTKASKEFVAKLRAAREVKDV